MKLFKQTISRAHPAPARRSSGGSHTAAEAQRGDHVGAGARFALLAAVLSGGTLVGCGGGSSAEVSTGGPPVDNGGNSFFFQDPHAGGEATNFRMSGIAFGRLVELFGVENGSGRRIAMGSDFLIDQDISSSTNEYELEINAVTGQEILIIDRDPNDPAERGQFIAIANQVSSGLDPIQVRDLGDPGVYSMLPRNAALVLTFDDLLDPSTITDRTVQLFVGAPPTTPFLPRIFADKYHGGTVGSTFYPTRVVLDLTISEIEAFSTDPPLPINGVGTPPSINVIDANAQVRVATRTNVAVGLTQVLTNLSGNELATVNNGPVDFSSATRPVTRAMRTGGRPDIINDPFKGFLRDERPAEIVGSTPIRLSMPPVQQTGPGFDPDGLDFMIPELVFDSSLCGAQPEVGDVVVQDGVFAVVQAEGGIPQSGVVTNIPVRLILFPSVWSGPEEWESVGEGPGTYESRFDPVSDADRPACYVQVLPRPTGAPNDPAVGIMTDSVFTIQFSEPMAEDSLTAFDSMTLLRSEFDPGVATPTSDYVVGRVALSADQRSVSFVPDQRLSHEQGVAENYFLRLANSVDDLFPPRDFAGNFSQTLPQIRFSVEESELTSLNGGRVSRFTSIDEDPPQGAEFGGQVLIDNLRQLLRPRPVALSQVVVDNSQPLMNQMNPLPGTPGVVTPHSPFGSKMQTLWRYADCGFAINDQQDQNIDIAGLSWSPSGGNVTPDAFNTYEIRLAHSRWAPDEFIDASTAWPLYPDSGLSLVYDSNILASVPTDYPSQVLVHERSRGYTIEQGNLYTAATGTVLLPFPMNQGLPFEERRYFTWRDADNRGRAGGSSGGVEPRSYALALGFQPPQRPFFRPGQVQTVGLPLLMEFRVFPDASAAGLNGWDFNIAVNSSSKPYFRAFTTGGTNTSGTLVNVNPDNQATAAGGFSPGANPPGASTPGGDNVVHIGAIDFVTRVSHSPSIWFESTIDGEDPNNFPGRVYSEPTLEPRIDDQPDGTNLVVRYRGASDIQYFSDEHGFDPPPGTDPNIVDNDGDDPANDPSAEIPDFQADARLLDLYGDYYNDREGLQEHNIAGMNPGLTFQTDEFWRDSVNDIEDARFYQVRLTFYGNPENGQSPEVSAFAITWAQP